MSATSRVLESLPEGGPEEVEWHGYAVFTLQIAAENWITDIMRLAQSTSEHAGRESVRPEDIQLVCKMIAEINPPRPK